VTPDSSNICTNDNQVDQNAVECVDERAVLANLIANLTLDTEENASLTQELEKCKTNLDETNSALGEAISCRDSCLIALQNKQNEFEKYLKKAQSEKPCLYEIPFDTSDPANRFAPEREETMTHSITETEIVDQTWFKHTSDCFRVPTAHDMELLIKTFLMPLSIKSQNDSFRFEHELKTEMHEDFKYVKSLEKEIDELESEKADFSNMYDLLLEECVSKDIVQLILFIVDSGCTKHMTGNLKLLCNFVEKFLGTVRFGNDQFAPILGYGDLIQGNVTIKRVAFKKSSCFVRDLQGNDLLTGLPKLTYVKDQLCLSCEMSKAKRSSFKSKAVPSSKGRLNLLHMDLCSPMRDETPEVLKDFLTMIQRNLQAQVITVRTDRGTEFLNKTLHAYFKEEGIEI
ncbi:retrovirus-related pol polyprotein from transposon TNT 1-94, partial [Tanacetum coccineum]